MTENRILSDQQLAEFNRRLNDPDLKQGDIKWIADAVVRKIREDLVAEIADCVAERKGEIADEIVQRIRNDIVEDQSIRNDLIEEIADRILEKKAAAWSGALKAIPRVLISGLIVLLFWHYVIKPFPVWFPLLIGALGGRP